MRYPEVLSGAWADHRAKRAKGAPTVISTFAGCGGSSLGYSMAGYNELLAVEWEENAVAQLRANFPKLPVFHGDIGTLSVDDVLARCKLKPGELDVFDGSPPCQGFSTAGKRNLEDQRNQLFREYARLLIGLRPKVFVMENVSGMVIGMKLIFADTIRTLKGAGYGVSARLMNTMYFGVPQQRARMIFIGVREDLGVAPSHPRAQQRQVPVRSAIGHLPAGEPGKHETQVIDAWRRSAPNQSLRKVSQHVGSFQSVRLDPDRPSPTQIKAHLNWHYAVPRHLTIEEAALIASFPPEYQWVGSKTDAKERIGNSVPPLFMRAIARHVRTEILGR